MSDDQMAFAIKWTVFLIVILVAVAANAFGAPYDLVALGVAAVCLGSLASQEDAR